MAPIKDETVDNLRDLVQKLESRVQQLEAKLEGSAGVSGQQTKGDGPSIRMILMGPPGAGKKNMPSSGYRPPLTRTQGKGTQAPKIKDKYCACHLVR